MFRSFYSAGFECATGYNMHGEWIDQIVATEHDRHVDADYARLAEVDIHAVREAVRWPLVDRGGGVYDFTSVEPFVTAAMRHRFDVIWDLFHYGYPDGVDPFSSAFVERFAAYCRAAARFLCKRTPGPHYFTPINEPSYYSWAAGHAGHFAPHQKNRGIELKVNLARACLRGIDAIREVCPGARIVNVDPICYVVPKTSAQSERDAVDDFNENAVYQFWDLVSGRIHPELGGRPDALDIIGINYYWTNQWEHGSEGTPLADDDPRRVPLGELVRRTWQRYGNDVVITETSERPEERGRWVHELGAMAEGLLDDGVKLRGICLYPILGMPEWHARDQWTRMGLWDLEREEHRLERKIVTPMLEALRVAQRRIAGSVRIDP
jgi:beta-glucosidase/6-phospho-beta-glucosidase/beta-galactosidase